MKAWLMYVYHGHLKIRKGTLVYIGGGSFLPDDKPKGPLMCKMPFDRYYNNLNKLPYTAHIVFNKYQFGKVLIKDEKDIPKWKAFFAQLYSNKIKETENGYKTKLWTNLLEELSKSIE